MLSSHTEFPNRIFRKNDYLFENFIIVFYGKFKETTKRSTHQPECSDLWIWSILDTSARKFSIGGMQSSTNLKLNLETSYKNKFTQPTIQESHFVNYPKLVENLCRDKNLNTCL